MNYLPPIEAIAYAAGKLGDLLDEVVFLGGAVVGLLITDEGAREPRATNDVDVTIEIGGLVDYYALDKRLLERGFKNDAQGPLCRYLHGPIIIDVMPTTAEVLGFASRWYPAALESAHRFELKNGTRIKLIAAPCFLATKVEAFEDPSREAHHDLFMSRDFGDVVSVIDGRSSIVLEVRSGPEELRAWLKERFTLLLDENYLFEAISEHVDPGREDLVIERMKGVAG